MKRLYLIKSFLLIIEIIFISHSIIFAQELPILRNNNDKSYFQKQTQPAFVYIKDDVKHIKNDKIQSIQFRVIDSLFNAYSYFNSVQQPFIYHPSTNTFITIKRGYFDLDSFPNYSGNNTKDNLFLRTSTDLGITWSDPYLLFDAKPNRSTWGTARYPSIFAFEYDKKLAFVFTASTTSASKWLGIIDGIYFGDSEQPISNFSDQFNYLGTNYVWSGFGSKILGGLDNQQNPYSVAISPASESSLTDRSNLNNIANRTTSDFAYWNMSIPFQWKASNFEPVSGNLVPTTSVIDFKFDSSNNMYFAASGYYTNGTYSNDIRVGVSKSTDFGKSWSDFDICPHEILRDYVSSKGYHADSVSINSTSPKGFSVFYNGDYSIVANISDRATLDGKSQPDSLQLNQIIEIYKENNSWGIRKVADISGYIFNYHSINGFNQSINQMIFETMLARTVDGKALLCKWVDFVDVINLQTGDTIKRYTTDIFVNVRLKSSTEWGNIMNITQDEMFDRITWITDYIPNDLKNIPILKVETIPDPKDPLDSKLRQLYIAEYRQYVKVGNFDAVESIFNPPIIVDCGSDKTICLGDTVQIGSVNPATGGSPPYRYLWTPSLGLSNDTVPNPMASPQQSTVYSLIVLDTKDSSVTDSVIVTVNPLPEAQVKGNRDVMLNSTVIYSSDTPAGIENEWSVENGTQIGPDSGSTFQVMWGTIGFGKVMLMQTNAATGCHEADTIDINITTTIPTLTADAGSDISVCLGDTVQIGSINAASGGVEPYKYKWTPSQGLNDDTIPNPKAYPVSTTDYTLNITDSKDSVTSDKITVTVNPLPSPRIKGNDKAMKGTIVSYTVNVQVGTTNEWSVENGFQYGSGKDSSFQVRWDSSGTGKVIVNQLIIATGCHASDTLIVNIDAQQYAAILDVPDMSAEPGGEIYLPIYLRDAELLANTNVTGFIAELKFNATLLEPVETTPIGSLSPDGKERIIPLRLGVTPSSDSTIQYLSFRATLGNDSITVFRLENISSIGANVNIGSLPGTFTLTGICREGGARLIGSNGQVQLMLVRPNPAQEFAEIEYETTESGRTQLYLINALGETALSLVNGEVPKGRKIIQLNIDEIKSGAYFLILKTTTQVRSVRVDVVK